MIGLLLAPFRLVFWILKLPLRLVFFEQWADRAALLAHFAVPASRDFVKSLQSLAAAATTIELYDATRLEKL